MTYHRIDEETNDEIVLEEIALEGDYEPLERYTSFPKSGRKKCSPNDIMTNPQSSTFPLFTFTTPEMEGEEIQQGLTKREYFAVQIMAALIVEKKYPLHSIPVKAVQLANELIKELNEENS